MKQLNVNLEKYSGDKLGDVKSNFVNERQELIQKFVDRINAQRGKGFKPVTWTQINGQLNHLKNYDLIVFHKQCCEAKHFSKYFWWAIKPKVQDQNQHEQDQA